MGFCKVLKKMKDNSTELEVIHIKANELGLGQNATSHTAKRNNENNSERSSILLDPIKHTSKTMLFRP